MIVERVNAGLANARAKGVRLGRPEKDPTSADRIAALREEGWSLRKIAARENLSAAGVLKILNRSKSIVLQPESTAIAEPEPKSFTEVAAAPVLLDTPPDVNPEIYQFRISILGISPQIWRRVQIRSDRSLAHLSNVIQASFDWGGYHLHKFMCPSPFGQGLEIEEGSEDTPLSDMRLQPGDSLLYEYDFGDRWMHEVIFEKLIRYSKTHSYPACTAGKNAGPPEDCGGSEAYMNARNYLSRRKGKRGKAPRGRVSGFEKEFYRENYKGFDPDEFDREEVNQQLKQLN